MQNTVCSKKEWEKKIGKRGQEEKKVGGGIFEVLYTIYGGNQQKGFQENLWNGKEKEQKPFDQWLKQPTFVGHNCRWVCEIPKATSNNEHNAGDVASSGKDGGICHLLSTAKAFPALGWIWVTSCGDCYICLVIQGSLCSVGSRSRAEASLQFPYLSPSPK